MLVPIAAWTLVTLAVGWVAGRRYERAARGWSDLRVHKAQTPVLRAAARVLSVKAAVSVLAAATVAAWAVHILLSEGR